MLGHVSMRGEVSGIDVALLMNTLSSESVRVEYQGSDQLQDDGDYPRLRENYGDLLHGRGRVFFSPRSVLITVLDIAEHRRDAPHSL
jgi:hypothetical protein